MAPDPKKLIIEKENPEECKCDLHNHSSEVEGDYVVTRCESCGRIIGRINWVSIEDELRRIVIRSMMVPAEYFEND